MSGNWKSWFSPKAVSREEGDTLLVFREWEQVKSQSPLYGPEAIHSFVLELVVDICAENEVTPSAPLGRALYRTITDLIIEDGFLVDFTGESSIAELSIDEGVTVRAALRRQLWFVRDHERLLALWRHKVLSLFSGLLEYFPVSAFTDVDAKGQSLDDSIVLPEARAHDLCENLPELLDRTLITLNDQDVIEATLFQSLRDRLDQNARVASGLKPDPREGGQPLFPTEQKNQKPDFLVSAYLNGTPLAGFFEAGLPFAIPFPARFEHTHIIGGTGHGKTQLMQFLINHDLVRAMEDGRSVVVIDSQGDLIRTVSRLKYFSPDAEQSLAERFVMIDPTDIAHPVCLNMFDFNRSRLSGYAPLDREKILNATVELYDYFFGALLGAELTQRQGLIFKYLARLLIEIPGATIHTLRELMEDGERFLPYMEQLTGTTRNFFATRFFDRSFNETKKQILARLWGVLSNNALERMFSHKESKVDVFDLLNSGKIIFINTAKDLLGQEGAAIFGRFFIALIAQAAVQRSAIPAHERNPAFVYIDEAQDYFDENIANLLTQARKYRVGLIFAHQSLDQLGSELRSSVLSNTTIKFAGGVSAKDASGVAAELRCDSEFLLSQKRRANHTEFSCYVRNFTTKALSVEIPLGYVESLPTLSASEVTNLRDSNRAMYCAPPEAIPEAEFRVGKKEEKRPAAPKQVTPVGEVEPGASTGEITQASTPSAPSRPTKARPAPPDLPTPGRGGREHKYLQHLIKQLAEDRGFRATIEENILDGAGQVDVSLICGKRRIACEISVTTSRDHELQNVEKCLAAGYREILLVGATERHAKTLAKFIEDNIEEGHGASIRYASPENLLEFLDDVGAPAKATESTVRGYKVKTTSQRLSPEDAAKRRATLAGVIAKSIRKKAGD